MMLDMFYANKAADHYYNLIRKNFDPATVAAEHTEFSHFYRRYHPTDQPGRYVAGELYGSVTQKLEVIPHPGLLQWHVNKVVEDIRVHWMPNSAYSQEEINKVIEDAKQVPINEFEGAGNIGGIVHNIRADYFQRWIQTGSLQPDWPRHDNPAVDSCLRGLWKFLGETFYIPVRTEMMVYDDALKLGGTLDDLGILPEMILGKQHNHLVLMDIKTSNSLKNIYWWQVALYWRMACKLFHIRPKYAFILKLSKDKGTYEIEYLKNIPELVKEAKSIIKLNSSIDRVEQNRKREFITI